LSDIPTNSELYQNILIEGKENAPETLDQLSGELHASAAAAMISSERVVQGVNLDRIREHAVANRGNGSVTTVNRTYDSAKGGMESTAHTYRTLDSNGIAIWGNLVSDELSLDGNGNAADLDQSMQGFFVGANVMLGQGWSAGLSFGNTNADVDVSDRNSSAEVESLTFAATLGRSMEVDHGFVNVLLGASYTSSDIESRRRAQFGGLNNTYNADYDADALQIFGELGYEYRLSDRSTLEPFLRLGWTDLSTNSYSENGGAGSLSSSGFDNDRLVSLLGLRYGHDFQTGSIPSRVHGTIGWEHVFGDEFATASHSFSGGPAFGVESASYASDSAVLGLGIDFDVTESMRIGASYIGRFSSEERDDTLELKASWSF
jgi:outer membrane autotransporter protein